MCRLDVIPFQATTPVNDHEASLACVDFGRVCRSTPAILLVILICKEARLSASACVAIAQSVCSSSRHQLRHHNYN